ncbi:NAD-dependent epimerase/dehydratase family protein [Caulobacter sp. ErkDOM-E]|uniref:NAD-dependent epimerase/dehydratase family protein n=1 Tax=Caulobacter sp. ErkDOM-E TaxID=3402778 RepID=UPI003AF544BF
MTKTSTADQASAATALVGQRILITGASGFIGTHLARRLADAGAELVCLDLKPPRVVISGVKYVKGDVRDMAALDLPKIDRIFNLAAVHTTPGHPDHEYYDTNVNGALEVTKLAERDGVNHITFTSSISVYGPSEERKTEASLPAPVSAYGKSKLMAEKIHETWRANGEGRKLTVVRPAVVFGAGEGGNFARMAALLKKGFFVFPGRRDTIKSCIYVEDLLDLALLAGNTDSSYELLNGAYPECPTLETIVTNLRDQYFPKAKLYDVPQGLVMSAAKTLATFKGFGLGIHPDRVNKLLRSTNVYPTWAERRGLLSQTALHKGLERWAEATNHSFI